MIRALIFDLDGTLVQTERLKALSYAQAARELCPHTLDEDTVIAAFKDVVGLSRKEVATALIERFDLTARARERMAEFGVSTPWQAFVQVRLGYYESMLADPDVLRRNQWPHTVGLLTLARETGCAVGLATMSHCAQVRRVLEVLGLAEAFDFVATRDDVHRGKPDPEIYELVAAELGVPPGACLVIEDSPAGVQAALAAGMHVIAVSTPFTGPMLHSAGLIDPRWIVDDPAQLEATARQLVALRRR
ncbi:MAG: beta-phosphoglucomutase [Anaerolineae bacterium]